MRQHCTVAHLWGITKVISGKRAQQDQNGTRLALSAWIAMLGK
jgi:hypothetical protein